MIVAYGFQCILANGGNADGLVYKTCLVVIVLLLVVVAFRPIIFPQEVEAARRYKYVAAETANAQADLDKYAADGWERTGAYMMDINNGAVLIFRK